ncbi:MAG TPA: hypothetical protein VFI76_05110 [Terrimicrobiaceae bacterium]|nr:hypothetical protein [Terrimicrobiaceae bacterium]
MSRRSRPPHLLQNLLPVVSRTASAKGAIFDVGRMAGPAYIILGSAAGSGGTTTLAVSLENSAPAAATASFTTIGTGDTELKTSASGNTEIAAKWTQSGARTLRSVVIPIKTNGSPSGAATLACKIYADSSGVPTGAALATSDNVLVSSVDDAYESITFTFSTPLDLSDATVYHLALTASYTASEDDNVMWRTGTVGSGGNASTKDATTWSAVATNNREFIANGNSWAAVSGSTFTTASGAASKQMLTVQADALNEIRVSATQGAGSTFVYGVTGLFVDDVGASS